MNVKCDHSSSPSHWWSFTEGSTLMAQTKQLHFVQVSLLATMMCATTDLIRKRNVMLNAATRPHWCSSHLTSGLHLQEPSDRVGKVNGTFAHWVLSNLFEMPTDCLVCQQNPRNNCLAYCSASQLSWISQPSRSFVFKPLMYVHFVVKWKIHYGEAAYWA